MTAVPYIALDFPNLKDAEKLIDQLKTSGAKETYGLKIGLELFTQMDQEKVKALSAQYPIFLDLKIWDIPMTLEKTVLAFCEMGISYFTFHASGGEPSFKAVAEALRKYSQKNPSKKIPTALAITVLTSYSESEWQNTMHATVDESLNHFAKHHAKTLSEYPELTSHLGWVCSGKEVESLHRLTPDAPLMVPGIRWDQGANKDDQTRTMTPQETKKYPQISAIVVGRPITQATDPKAALVDLFARLR
jgi:orotidine-5'-phosphate decarboxylase